MNAKNSAYPDFPIDMVYLWVDGNDPEWRAKRSRYMDVGGNFAGQGRVEARWVESDELRYSLRSVEKFAPWIRRIFIVTDNQCPSWLDRSNPRIQIVDHTEIMPAEALPCFNSTAIESCIYKIEGLAEHFLFANDDMLLSQPVSPATFFAADGKPIIRLSGTRFNRRKVLRRGENYSMMLYRMQDKVAAMSGKKIYYAPHHNIDAYRRSDFARCIEIAGEAWGRTLLHRFRHDEDMHRSFMAYYAIANHQGVLRKVGRYNGAQGVMGRLRSALSGCYSSDSRCIPIQAPDYEAVFRKYNPLMFCMNDGEGATDADRERMADFLRSKFPEKSQFEK